jgi:hypothetical protein
VAWQVNRPAVSRFRPIKTEPSRQSVRSAIAAETIALGHATCLRQACVPAGSRVDGGRTAPRQIRGQPSPRNVEGSVDPVCRSRKLRQTHFFPQGRRTSRTRTRRWVVVAAWMRGSDGGSAQPGFTPLGPLRACRRLALNPFPPYTLSNKHSDTTCSPQYIVSQGCKS